MHVESVALIDICIAFRVSGRISDILNGQRSVIGVGIRTWLVSVAFHLAAAASLTSVGHFLSWNHLERASRRGWERVGLCTSGRPR